MYEGIVDWFADNKGYGFINYTDTNGKTHSVFAHYTAINNEGFKTLNEGQEVTFDMYEDKRGKTAKNIQGKKRPS